MLFRSPTFAKKAGVSQSVGQDFSKADKGKTFKRGGDMAAKKPNPFMEMIAKKKEKSEGESKSMDKKEGKAGEMAEKFAKGGSIRGKSGYVGMGKKENAIDGSSMAGENPKIQKRGLTEGRIVKMASGGSVDGIAQRGKTRGKMC